MVSGSEAREKILVAGFRHFFESSDGPVQATETIDLSIRAGEFVFQMYSDAAIRGPGGRHSTRSAAGGLITAQSANDIVRDHRYTPSLLVRLNWCR